MGVKPRHDKGFVGIDVKPADLNHRTSEAGPADDAIHRVGGVSVEASVLRMRVEYTPDRM
ncbi:hypothetical protein BG60_26245 [Caballeronia zhejiangensis]|uniref:Uncharacterized protein n=1 Tax=Caballeronia zhejiangensis TaxID=871203 RepID=A0A656QAY5_9BURK|nr:hypothetical protein BG60_26245 [Caballeronia zhejiangensis]